MKYNSSYIKNIKYHNNYIIYNNMKSSLHFIYFRINIFSLKPHTHLLKRANNFFLFISCIKPITKFTFAFLHFFDYLMLRIF
jgi:hypothetical protein